MNPIELSIFANRAQAVCDEMGAVLRRSAFSPNIRDRLDFSCAVFDKQGDLCAQAAHIPVHLGSMAYAMRGIVGARSWADGQMLILNDPYLGGTHLPDVTLIAPVFVGHRHVAFVANRAHHADIGGDTPGSMPLSRRLEDEGTLIAPRLIMSDGRIDEHALSEIVSSTRNHLHAQGDLSAQISANLNGIHRLTERVTAIGADAFEAALAELNDYAERLALSALDDIPRGIYPFRDVMDDDGAGHPDPEIRARVTVDENDVHVDFEGTSPQAAGNINCPLSVTAAAVYYAFRCLMPPDTPACAGSLRPIRLSAPLGCLVNARRPAAVAAGNVETSTRIVDVILGALAEALPDKIPAASHGSMNNVAMGSTCDTRAWDYYETIGGGMGAGPAGEGLDAVQTHMTNTLNTPIEALEIYFPIRIRQYAIRDASGGTGLHRGGHGIRREFEFLNEAKVTLITERRRHRPWGLAGGNPGALGQNSLNGIPLPGKAQIEVGAGDRLLIETPGGGGWGDPGRGRLS